jgi:hypothetical protein
MGEVASVKLFDLSGWTLTISIQWNVNEASYFLNLSLAADATRLASPLLAGGHGRLAEFEGVNGHITTGRSEIGKKDGGFVVNLLDDFTLDGAPDP